MNKTRIGIIVFLLLSVQGIAQYKLSLQQAIELAIQNNYSINIARIDADINRISNTYGNAGFLPTISFLASTNRSSYNTKQEFNTGASVNRKNAISTNFSSAIALDWTLFDGMKMFATKDKLTELEARGKVNLKIEMENTVSQVITFYFDIVRIQQLIKAINESLNISVEREKLAQKKLDIGSGSKLELLQAKVDLNSQKSALLKLDIDRQNSIIALNQLLSKGGYETYSVEDSITINDALVLTSVQQAALSNNSALFYAQHNIASANYRLKEYKSNSLPQVGVTLNYNLSRTQNQVGLILLNRNQGLNAGLYASWTLFNGFQNRTQINIAKYNIDQSRFYLKQTSSVVDASLLKSWNRLVLLNRKQSGIILS